MKVATVDLDDTLMRAGHDYVDARNEFGELMEREYGVESKVAAEKCVEIDKNKVNDMGLSLERFPTSFVHTLHHFVESPPEKHIERVDSIARTAYKSEEEYAERGFMEGAEEMLYLLQDVAEEVHIITAGVPRLQNRKIRALGLNSIVEESHVVEMNTKDQYLEQIREDNGVDGNSIYHVGNSEDSDVKAALNAGVMSVYIPNGTQWRGSGKFDPKSNERIHLYESHHEFNNDLQKEF